jgi:hypothetical protein
MLNIKLDDLGDRVHKGIRDIVHALSVRHVSKYPIDVVIHPDHASRHMVNEVYFLDSRFDFAEREDPSFFHGAIAVMSNVAGEYHLRSIRIKNNKYNPHSDGYRLRKTTDSRKMMRFLKEIIKPLTNMEIAAGSESIRDRLVDWCAAPEKDLFNMLGDIRSKEVLEEIAHLQSLGVQFRGPTFQRIASEGLTLKQVIRERREVADNLWVLHVYEQPDGAVSVVLDSRANYLFGSRVNTTEHTYQNMELVPESIRQATAMLKIADINTYIPEVGKRNLDGSFWVQIPKQDFAPTP